MVAGVTGVLWITRPSEVNSATLHAGAHAIPISAAGTAWGGLTAAWIDATTTVARVMAELGVGMQGLNGIAALGKLTGFLGWSEQQGVQSAAMAGKAAANVIAYTVAALAMPSPPEIAAVNAALAASTNPAGAVSGAFEAAEIARNAMDIRAALVMETYEAATSAMLAVPADFLMPPPIAAGAGQANPGGAADAATQVPLDPIQGAIAAVQAFVSNPGVANAATQAAQAVASVATTGATTVGNVAGSAITAATSSTPMATTSMVPMAMGGALATASGATRAVSFASSSAGGANSTLKLPAGWGVGNVIGGSGSATAVPETAVSVEAAPTRTANSSGNPLLGNQARGTEDDESEHNSHDYLRAEHFNDGRLVADGVIGADGRRDV
ncbi:PPE family protein [Nocardia sp. NBC_00565]|uniref:PPE family protein n=1 Tax=Nocardia sp. NBC_00565 TaxID=2975993 RepID=UPI002E81D820|nr:PPE family protein [Nocardia sp. NBC_00565]WUC01940.1 PPE family protein [Nocardia sp. NBC_00565]